MALKTRSKFYYGLEILPEQNFIDINDGVVFSVTLSPRSYSLSRMPFEVEAKLNAASLLNFTLTIDRTTRIATLSADGTFDLLLGTGPHAANSAMLALGFTQGIDLTGQTSYSGIEPVGKEYLPQFYLLDYKPSSSRQEAIGATVNETGSGRAEIVKYGSRKFVSFTIDFVTNVLVPQESWIERDSQGYEKLVDFLQWCVDKKEIEFMADREDVTTFEVLQIERTSASSLGIGYDIQEKPQYPEFFTSGNLQFRVI